MTRAIDRRRGVQGLPLLFNPRSVPAQGAGWSGGQCVWRLGVGVGWLNGLARSPAGTGGILRLLA